MGLLAKTPSPCTSRTLGQRVMCPNLVVFGAAGGASTQGIGRFAGRRGRRHQSRMRACPGRSSAIRAGIWLRGPCAHAIVSLCLEHAREPVDRSSEPKVSAPGCDDVWRVVGVVAEWSGIIWISSDRSAAQGQDVAMPVTHPAGLTHTASVALMSARRRPSADTDRPAAPDRRCSEKHPRKRGPCLREAEHVSWQRRARTTKRLAQHGRRP